MIWGVPDSLGCPERRRSHCYCARQNVILELGFFLGKLKDFNKVFVLRKNPPEAWPEFGPPSDLAGAIFKEIDPEAVGRNCSGRHR